MRIEQSRLSRELICKNEEAVLLSCILSVLYYDGGMDSEGNWHKETGSVWNVNIPTKTGDFLGEESNQRGCNQTYAQGEKNNSNNTEKKIKIYRTCNEREQIFINYYAGKNPRKEIYRKETKIMDPWKNSSLLSFTSLDAVITNYLEPRSQKSWWLPAFETETASKEILYFTKFFIDLIVDSWHFVVEYVMFQSK